MIICVMTVVKVIVETEFVKIHVLVVAIIIVLDLVTHHV